MRYSAVVRDRYRLAVAAVSGLVTVGTLSATGLIAGAAASEHHADLAAKAAEQRAERLAYRQAVREHRALVKASKQYAAALGSDPQVVVRERPRVTRVTTQYLSSGGSTSVGTGGSVTGGYTGGSTGGTTGGSGSSSGG
ncbi:MAG TPA: hypothetical protein PLP61_15835, partial [Nocardioides sp.]|uniref:hypothetical protein n=1 Tax=Nocardioides sp. TaxID=35761 RepID=UPI002CF98C05